MTALVARMFFTIVAFSFCKPQDMMNFDVSEQQGENISSIQEKLENVHKNEYNIVNSELDSGLFLIHFHGGVVLPFCHAKHIHVHI